MWDQSWMVPEPNISWSFKKSFLMSLYKNLCVYYLWEGRTLTDCLDSSFLKHASQFQFNLVSWVSRVRYGQHWAPVCQACPQSKLTTQRSVVISCWHLSFIYAKFAIQAWRNNILHSFLIDGELFCRIFSLKPSDSALIEERASRVRKPHCRV